MGISLQILTLISEKNLSPQNERLFNIIKEESDRLTNIISDFYNYLKESPPHKEEHDLKNVILDSIEVAQKSPEFKETEFITNLDENIRISIDKDQWKQVFLNLFLNADGGFQII